MPRKPTGRPPGRPKGVTAWTKVERARELLAQSAVSAVQNLKTAAKVAAKKGNHAPSAYILEHIAVMSDEGKEVRPLASGIDRQSIDSGPRMPVINIGWIGSAPQPTTALEPVIDVKALPETTD